MSDEFKDDLDTPTEADLDQCYGGKYLNAADIGDKKIRTRIDKIRKEMMSSTSGKLERPKLVAYLANVEKPMVINATNKNALVDKLGKNPANWVGADVGILAEDTTYAGKPTKGLRLRVLGPSKAATKAVAPQPKPKPAPKPAAAEEAPWPDQDGDPGSTEFKDAAE